MLRPCRSSLFACAYLLLIAAGATGAAATAKPAAPATPAAPAPADTLRPLPGPDRAAPAAHTKSPKSASTERGEREMVLIHGLGSNADVWDRMVPLLSRSYRVWLYELPGHGSTPPLPRLTIATAVENLGRYLKENDIVQPVLVGHAMGGLIAMRYAFDHPADVKRLIVIDAAPKQFASQELKTWTVDQLLNDYDRYVSNTYSNMSPDPEVTRRLVDQALKTDRASFTSLLMSSFKFDLTEELPRQSVPILLVASALLLPSDQNIPQQLDALGYADARTIGFKRVAKTGHFVMLEQPDYLASVILAWCLEH